jgi:hypothetical protein
MTSFVCSGLSNGQPQNQMDVDPHQKQLQFLESSRQGRVEVLP